MLNTKDANRIAYLDIMRGMAIFFIFLVNIKFLSGAGYYPDALKAEFPTAPLDQLLDVLIFIFVSGKFYYIFSILFGIGFAVQYHSFTQKTPAPGAFNRFFSRRMSTLLVIGLLHMFLVWAGDILTMYALLGFLLLYFRDKSDRTLLKWTLILMALPILHWLLMYATRAYYYYTFFDFVNLHADELSLVTSESANRDRPLLDNLARIQTEDLSVWLDMQLHLPIRRLAIVLMKGRLFKILAMFVLGLWIGRQILHQQILDNPTRLKKIALLGFAIGLPGNILLAILEYGSFSGNLKHFLNHLLYALSVAPLACAYMATTALLVRRHPHARLWRWLAPIGKTALSNYLFQSVIGVLLFYGIGFGLAGKLSLSEILGITLLIFLAQIAFSRLWLSIFQFGPIEWLWRMITYQRFVPLLKKS